MVWNEKDYQNTESEDSESQDNGGVREVELEEVDEKLRKDVPLKNTPYDAVILALLCINDEGYVGDHPIATYVQFAWMLVLHLLNIVGQAMLMCYLFAGPIVELRGQYLGVEAKTTSLRLAISEHRSLNKTLPAEAAASDMCADYYAPSFSHLLILAIWNTKILGELRDAYERAHAINDLPITRDLDRIVTEAEVTGGMKIGWITSRLKYMCVLFVCVPQSMLAICLAWIGNYFLFFTPDIGKLVFKSMSLFFISTLDELLFTTYAPSTLRIALTKTSYRVRQPRNWWHWNLWVSSTLRLLVVWIVAALVIYVHFGPESDFRHTCLEYKIATGEKKQFWVAFNEGLHSV